MSKREKFRPAMLAKVPKDAINQFLSKTKRRFQYFFSPLLLVFWLV